MVALIVGGSWAYNEFVRERPHFPRAAVEIASIDVVQLPGGSSILRADIVLANVGEVLLKVDKALFKVEQIFPLVPPCEPSQDCLSARGLVVPQDRRNSSPRLKWPTIVYFEGTISQVLLEPGERQTVPFETIVPTSVETVRVYAYFQNRQLAEPDQNIGWTASRYFDLKQEVQFERDR